MARKLTFTINGRTCYPNYSGDISFASTRQSDERYYRTTISEELIFTDGSGDYSWIMSQPFDTEFKLVVTTDNNFTWRGVFYKTDCKFDADSKTVTVKPDTDDLYKRIIERIDDTIDVVKLAPKATEIGLSKRAVLQVYIVTNGNVGDKILTNWLGNMTWEEDVTVGDDYSADSMRSFLTSVCHFTYNMGPESIRIKGGTVSAAEGMYLRGNASRINTTGTGSWTFNGPNGYYIIVLHESRQVGGVLRNVTTVSLYKSSGTRIDYQQSTSAPGSQYPGVELNGYATYASYDYYMRWLHDKDDVSGSYSKDMDNDLSAYTLNYRYVKPYTETGLYVEFTTADSDEPTEYGMDEYGKYFTYPDDFITPGFQFRPYHPIARSTWSPFAVWLQADFNTFTDSDTYSVAYTIRDAYSLPNIIKVLLKEMVPDAINGVHITHEDSVAYSSWLYSSSTVRKPYLVPNSNVKKTYYSNPAQTGEISMRQLLDMLRDCFNVYWYIKDDGKFCLEHISAFMSGNIQGNVEADLTYMMAPRCFNKWAYGQNKWSYDKMSLPERVEYSFGENQTDPFNGCVLQYKSNYVKKGVVEKISISGFSADVDYTIELPSSVSDNGFVVVIPEMTNGVLKVPVEFILFRNAYVAVQNGKMSFDYLFFDSLRYNMSCPKFKFVDKDYDENSADGAKSTARVRKQSVTFPADNMPNPYGLIRTGLSTENDDGEIEDMQYYPLSDKLVASLNFDTEK